MYQLESGLLLSICAALSWGAGDFFGGRAAYRRDPFVALSGSAFSGLVLLALLAVFLRPAIPSTHDTVWALAAGGLGAFGLGCLYRGLGEGQSALVAPLAAVIGAAVPAVSDAWLEGLASSTQILGFALAFLGLWQVTRGASATGGARRSGIVLGACAGLGIGWFLLALSRIHTDEPVVPLLIARAGTLFVAVVILLARGGGSASLRPPPAALAAGALDAGGNALYFLELATVRLDVAAVLGSLYPAVTVILARMLVHEPVSRRQWIGIAICIAAVGLIAL